MARDLVRVLIVDDHPWVQRGMAKLIEGWEGFVVGGQALTSRRCLDLIRSEAFDVVILDLRLAGENGLDTLAAIRRLKPELPVVVHCIDSEHSARAALAAGAVSVVGKDEGPDKLERALRILFPSAA